jgi:hypothetical protein
VDSIAFEPMSLSFSANDLPSATFSSVFSLMSWDFSVTASLIS